MPTGGTVRQPVLDHDAHGGGDDAVGVVAVGNGQVQHVRVEVVVAMAAAVLRIAHEQIAGPAADRITQVVQRALGGAQAISAVTALGADAA